MIHPRLTNLYYRIRPLIPRRLQIAARSKICLRRLEECRQTWPIDEAAGHKPEGWQGWPEGKRFALVLTHDVESKKGLGRCKKLAAMERQFGFRSSFGFVPERYSVPPELRHSLEQDGFEAYVHGLKHDGLLYKSRKIFLERAKRINACLKDWGAVGFRSPAMHSNLKWIAELDIEYDSSTFDTDPFEPQPEGFGTIFPVLVHTEDREKIYVEMPYTLPQDLTLFVLLKEQNIDIWKRKLDWIVEKGGMALLNVHPDYVHFDDGRMQCDEYPARHYSELLTYIQTRYKDQYWNPAPKEMARFWRQATGEKKGGAMVLRDERVSSNAHGSRKETGKRAPRRVCMVSYSFYESDNRVMRYAEALAQRGDHVDIIALREKGLPWHDRVNGVDVWRIQTRDKNEKSPLSYLLKIMIFFCFFVDLSGLATSAQTL